MTASQRKTLHTLLLTVGAPLLVALLAWGARRYDEGKLDASRFSADSARREQRYSRDSINNGDLLRRIDSRVSAMYCGKLPVDQRAGCQ